MAGNQLDGDVLYSNIAGMSKNQMYDIMSQMKTLVDQNHDQARDILVQNPMLTRGLFQAQIMLGMVQPPQTASDTRPAASQEHTPPPQSNVQASPSLPVQTGSVDQTNVSGSPRKQQENHPAMPVPPASVPSLLQQQPRAHHNNAQAPLMSSLQQSQIHNMPPPHSSSQLPSPLQPPMSTSSTQLQQPPQPPLPPQPRPPSMQGFPHQLYPPPMGPNTNFQHSGGPHMHHSQPMFHSGVRPPTNVGPSFSQGQPPFPNPVPPQPLYQGGNSHLGMEFGQAGSSMQGERGPQFSGPPPPFTPPAQMGSGYQAPHAPPLTPDMEQALLQQVMSLTPEQINLLPPEQRNQVLQLQQIMRK